MSYPNLPQGLRSSHLLEDNVLRDRASNGTLRARSLWAAPKHGFTVVHTVDTAGRDTLEAFYLANRAKDFAFTYSGDGVTYTCVFAAAPAFEPMGGGFWRVVVKLLEV